MTTLKVTIPVEFKNTQIADFFVNFIESGFSRFWCELIEYTGPKTPAAADNLPWYCDPEIYDETFKVALTYEEDQKIDVTWESLQKGLVKLPPHIIGNLLDDYDANDTDLLLQYAAFGEEIYA